MVMLALQLVIGTGIALLFPMLIFYGIATVRRPPKSGDFISNHVNIPANASEADMQAERDRKGRERQAWLKAKARYAKILFTVMTPVGVAAMLGGYLLGINAIGIGLLTGGILCAVYGYAGYWNVLEQWMRFASILAGLLMLLYVGVRYLGLA
jgi:hypothetical protein